ncbi:sialidase family protein [Ramlibacter tataouinensis]|uniref:Uncharacterized protein n=1 Tax=Ramlibacter tataouinensis (strain ATCC BAA-407 / DSM 14655 / LMG 21543 / TTB310) TaxID=365046 RepID=F5XY35_RAMTT|nr:sialidase family protein [Ramlibacter tataouinensis]AEG94360.1 conserved hypothetical protein [Ramlibacter tataouinensis TTB310]
MLATYHHSRRFLLGLVLLLAAALLPARPPSPSVEWQDPVEIAAGRGQRGPWAQNESRYDFVDDPTVILAPDGDAAVAWVDQARKAVLFQRFGPTGAPRLAQPVDVSRQPATFSWLPRLAMAPDAPQRLFVLWQEIIFSGGSHGGEMMLARSEDGGRSFSAPVNLSNSTPGDGKGRINPEVWHNGSYDLVAGPGGVLYAAWTEYDGPLWFSRSTDGGRRFSRPLQLAGAGQAPPARGPSLALAADGTLYLAWTVGEDAAADIHVTRSTDGGATFDAPVRVAPSATYSDAPKLAVDPDGVLHLAYAESAGGPFERHRIHYTRSSDRGATFEPPRVLSQPLPPQAVSAAYPQLALDARGGVYVAWELYADERGRPRGLALAVSTDGGQRFGPASVVPGSADARGGANGSTQGLLMRKLAADGAGRLALVNSALREGSHSRVWMLRGAVQR